MSDWHTAAKTLKSDGKRETAADNEVLGGLTEKENKQDNKRTGT